jgi:hypothetical protein
MVGPLIIAWSIVIAMAGIPLKLMGLVYSKMSTLGRGKSLSFLVAVVVEFLGGLRGTAFFRQVPQICQRGEHVL